MASAEGLLMTSGAVAFVGSWKESGGFPEKGVTMVSSTIALVVLASLIKGEWEKPVKALAAVMLLAVAIRYIPGLATNKKTSKKGKKNG